MKPTKNKVFCISCRHRKMLFESQAKADNFIKFNSAEIEEQTGKAPVRSYYCSFCCGWHITSIADADKAAARDERDAQMWKKIKRKTTSKPRKIPDTGYGHELRKIVNKIDEAYFRVRSALFQADVSELREQFDNLLNLEKELRLKSSEYGIDVRAIDKRYDKISRIKTLFMNVFDYFIDNHKRQSYLAELSKDDLTKSENIIINNIEIKYQMKLFKLIFRC